MRSVQSMWVVGMLLFLFVGCDEAAGDREMVEESPALVPVILQVVKIKSSLSEEELLTTAKERATQFRKLPGLLQKYYVKLGPEGEYGGFYFWESREAMESFQKSDLPKTMPAAYQLTEPPSVEVYEVMFQLRE